MLNERTNELIQADVDGELAPSDHAELAEALSKSADARGFREEMLAVAKLMADTPDVDPPSGLRHRILDSIELPSGPRLMLDQTSWFKPASYGLALAAGVVLTVGVIQMTPETPMDLSNLVGSMVRQGQNIPKPVSAEMGIDLTALQGQVRLKSLERAWALEFNLQSEDEVEISIDFNGTGLSFGGFADYESQIERFEVSGGKVRLMNQGSHQFVLFLRSLPESDDGWQDIRVVVSHQGETIYSGSLESGG